MYCSYKTVNLMENIFPWQKAKAESCMQNMGSPTTSSTSQPPPSATTSSVEAAASVPSTQGSYRLFFYIIIY